VCRFSSGDHVVGAKACPPSVNFSLCSCLNNLVVVDGFRKHETGKTTTRISGKPPTGHTNDRPYCSEFLTCGGVLLGRSPPNLPRYRSLIFFWYETSLARFSGGSDTSSASFPTMPAMLARCCPAGTPWELLDAPPPLSARAVAGSSSSSSRLLFALEGRLPRSEHITSDTWPGTLQLSAWPATGKISPRLDVGVGGDVAAETPLSTFVGVVSAASQLQALRRGNDEPNPANRASLPSGAAGTNPPGAAAAAPAVMHAGSVVPRLSPKPPVVCRFPPLQAPRQGFDESGLADDGASLSVSAAGPTVAAAAVIHAGSVVPRLSPKPAGGRSGDEVAAGNKAAVADKAADCSWRSAWLFADRELDGPDVARCSMVAGINLDPLICLEFHSYCCSSLIKCCGHCWRGAALTRGEACSYELIILGGARGVFCFFI